MSKNTRLSSPSQFQCLQSRTGVQLQSFVYSGVYILKQRKYPQTCSCDASPVSALFLHCRTLFKLLYSSNSVIDVSFMNTTGREEIGIQVGMSEPQRLPYSMQWEQLVLTLQPRIDEGSAFTTPLTNDAGSVTIYHNQILQSNFTIDEATFPDEISSITVGDNFVGLIQDFGIYPLILGESGGSLVVPQEADFLPQCLCSEGYQISGESCNPTGSGMSMMRYVV